MGIAYRLGFPGWRIAATAGIPIKVRVDVCHDDKVGVYYATSPDIGLAVEGESLDDVVKEVRSGVVELLEVGYNLRVAHERPRADIRVHDSLAFA